MPSWTRASRSEDVSICIAWTYFEEVQEEEDQVNGKDQPRRVLDIAGEAQRALETGDVDAFTRVAKNLCPDPGDARTIGEVSPGWVSRVGEAFREDMSAPEVAYTLQVLTGLLAAEFTVAERALFLRLLAEGAAS